MAERVSGGPFSVPVDLVREAYAEGGHYQLLCCTSGPRTPGLPKAWVAAAELVYEITGNPGKVAGDFITFELDEGHRIEIDLVGGQFRILKGEHTLHSGRKAFELLMRMNDLTFESALEWIAGKFSNESAAAMADDYVKMRVAALPPTEGTNVITPPQE
jgi:hypothetical protein